MEEAGHQLSPAQLHQLMSVIAGMESVKEAQGEAGSPPPTDEEIQQFLDYVGCGVINSQRLEYEEERQSAAQAPEPPRRNKQACQYFWRRHYLSIIQEDDEEHHETPGASRPGSTYENNLSRLSRVIGALSPVSVGLQEKEHQTRGSWGSQSLESMTSINSILSEEGSMTSNGSFESSSDRPLNHHGEGGEVRRPPQSLSSLLENVLPPSNTPDSMIRECESPSVMRLSRAESEPEEASLSSVAKFKMGSKFKQSIQQIEELKRKGKRELKGFSDKVFQKDIVSKNDLSSRVDHQDCIFSSQSPNCSSKDLTNNPLNVTRALPLDADERVSNEVNLFWSLCSSLSQEYLCFLHLYSPIIRIALI